MRANLPQILLLCSLLCLASLALPEATQAAKTRAQWRLCDSHTPWPIFPPEHSVWELSELVFASAGEAASELLAARPKGRAVLPAAEFFELLAEQANHELVVAEPLVKVPRSESGLLIPALDTVRSAEPVSATEHRAANDPEAEAAGAEPSLGTAISSLRVKMLALRIEDNAAYVLKLAKSQADAHSQHSAALPLQH